MRHAIPITFVLAAILAPITGVAQETTRPPAQTRRAAPAEADDRRAPPAPLAPPQSSTNPAPSWQPPLPPTIPPQGPSAPAWQPTPPIYAPQPMMPPGPGPQQPGRYTLIDRELSVLDAEGDSTSLGPVTLLFDSATGEVSYLVREGSALAWRVVPRPPLHHQPPGHPAGSWTQPPPQTPPSWPPAPYPPGGAPIPAPSGVPAPPPQPFPSGDSPVPFTRGPGVAEPVAIANPLVDTAGFRDGVTEADRLRAERRVGEAAFLALATPESVILDCRSRESFARLHVRGAVNLPFPDITADELARLIPSPDTRVLLYCNNNFAAAPAAFPEKVARAALNHHSFATLVAYGYRNVFELAPLVDVASTGIPLEGDDAP